MEKRGVRGAGGQVPVAEVVSSRKVRCATEMKRVRAKHSSGVASNRKERRATEGERAKRL